MNITNISQNIPTSFSVSKEDGKVEGETVASIPVEDFSSVPASFDSKNINKIEDSANKLFDSLNTGLALKFHENSGQWYAVIENKLTREIIKEVPPKYLLDLQAKLKEMVGVFLDTKI